MAEALDMRRFEQPRELTTPRPRRLVWLGTLAIGLGLVGASPSTAQIHKWTDEHGHVHFSDVPRAGSEKVEIDPVRLQQSIESRDARPAATTREPNVPSGQTEGRASKVMVFGPNGAVGVQPASGQSESYADREAGCQRKYGASRASDAPRTRR